MLELDDFGVDSMCLLIVDSAMEAMGSRKGHAFVASHGDLVEEFRRQCLDSTSNNFHNVLYFKCFPSCISA